MQKFCNIKCEHLCLKHKSCYNQQMLTYFSSDSSLAFSHRALPKTQLTMSMDLKKEKET